MREIVFRGKCIDNGEWVEGNYGYFKAVNGEEKFHHITTENGKAFRVIPETVGQYTGLTDKNGVKIYEEDILPVLENGESFFYKVIYEGDCFMLAMMDSNQGSFALSRLAQYLREVIGNIHDNPELLGVEE